MMQYFVYLIYRVAIAVVAVVPLAVLHRISDGLAWLIGRVFKYRRGVMLTNLRNSFPEKSAADIEEIADGAYLNITDSLVESLKGISYDSAEIKRRVLVQGYEECAQWAAKGQPCLAVSAHFGNFEWGGLASALWLPVPVWGLYKPLSNRFINDFIKNKREKWGVKLYPIRQTTETFDKIKRQPAVIFMVCDQSPSNTRDAIWLDFLHQDTPFLHGLEKHASRLNMPVYYFDFYRVKRGYYQADASLLCANPQSLPYGELTRLYALRLEQAVLAHTNQWLWSHKRWKHQREDLES